MADPYVRQARGVFQVTIGSTDVKSGDLMYFDGTDWELADADDNTKFAEAIAVNGYSSGDEGVLCTSAIEVDTDAPFTQGSSYYLSATAGERIVTRPTGAENLCQVVGFGLSSSELRVEIQMPKEVTINLQFPYTESAAPQDVTGASADGDYHGVGLDDTSAAVGACFEVPQNMVGNVTQRLWHAGTGVLLDTGDTITIDVSGGVDDETTSSTVDGMSATSLAVAANDLALTDISTAFDGVGLLKPGNVIGLDITKAAEGSGGDDPIMLCATVVLTVV